MHVLVCLTTCPLKGIWIVSSFWLLQIKLLETFVYSFWVNISFNFSGMNAKSAITGLYDSRSWNSNTLATWCKDLTHLKRPWCGERLRAGGEEDDRGWDGWMASLTQWTWVWMNFGSWWWTGRRGMLQFMGSQRARHDSDWTELIIFASLVLFIYLFLFFIFLNFILFLNFTKLY